MAFNNHLGRRHYVYGALLVVSAGIFSWLTISILESDNPTYANIGIFWGSLLVAAGWIITNEIAILNTRRQHTVSLITAYFTNAQLIEDRKTIQKSFPSYKDKITSKFNFHAKNELNQAIVRELNYYEFLAAAMYRRDLDSTLLKDCLGQIMINVYEQMEEYIVYWRGENSLWWSYLAKLHSDWTSPEGLIEAFTAPTVSALTPPSDPTKVRAL